MQMLNSRSLATLFIFLIINVEVYSQKSISSGNMDILVEYDTVTIYDTIYVYDTIVAIDQSGLISIDPITPSFNLLQLDTVSHNGVLFIISRNRSAVIPLDNIIISKKTKHYKTRKNINFGDVVQFAFRNMVLPQSDYGISTGAGTWWAKCNKPISKVEYTPTFNAGIFFEMPVSRKVFIRPELNYTYLMSNYSYKAEIDTMGWLIAGDSESASDYHQLSIPILIGYKFGRFKPSLGAEYSYRISELWLNKKVNSFGLMANVGYTLTNKLTASLNYYYGLTKDVRFEEPVINTQTGEMTGMYNYYWKSYRFGVTFHYIFNPSKKYSFNR